jgi:hypothetical protein
MPSLHSADKWVRNAAGAEGWTGAQKVTIIGHCLKKSRTVTVYSSRD